MKMYNSKAVRAAAALGTATAIAFAPATASAQTLDITLERDRIIEIFTGSGTSTQEETTAATSSEAAATTSAEAPATTSEAAPATTSSAAELPGVTVSASVDLDIPTLSPEEIEAARAELYALISQLLEQAGVTVGDNQIDIDLTLDAVIDLAALLEQPIEFINELELILSNGILQIEVLPADEALEVIQNVINQIRELINQASQEIENTDIEAAASEVVASASEAAASASESAAASDSSAASSSSSATDADVAQTSDRQMLASTGPELIGLILAALTLGGAGFLLTRRGARS